jgi:hypothetical protein
LNLDYSATFYLFDYTFYPIQLLKCVAVITL